MANNQTFGHTPGATLYAILTDTADRYAIGTATEAGDATHWASYAIPVPESSIAGRYILTFPALFPGLYHADIYNQIGVTPSSTADDIVIDGEIVWDGTDIVSGISSGGGGGGSGDGSVVVTQDTGGIGNLRVVDGAGNGIDGVTVRAYLTSEWSVDPSAALVRGQQVTTATGDWQGTMNLDPASYTFVFSRPGYVDMTKVQVIA